jgi:hypothetical protein
MAGFNFYNRWNENFLGFIKKHLMRNLSFKSWHTAKFTHFKFTAFVFYFPVVKHSN